MAAFSCEVRPLVNEKTDCCGSQTILAMMLLCVLRLPRYKEGVIMILFGELISIKSITFLMFSIFSIVVLGYALGRIKIKGIELGTAGVFVVSLIYGCLFYQDLSHQLLVAETPYIVNALKIIENIGLILFVSAVGFIAGPNFFQNFRKNYKSYVLLGFTIILSGALTCVICILLGRSVSGISREEFTALMSGIMSLWMEM